MNVVPFFHQWHRLPNDRCSYDLLDRCSEKRVSAVAISDDGSYVCFADKFGVVWIVDLDTPDGQVFVNKKAAPLLSHYCSIITSLVSYFNLIFMAFRLLHPCFRYFHVGSVGSFWNRIDISEQFLFSNVLLAGVLTGWKVYS